MAQTMFFVGFCPSCGTGPLGVRICGACGAASVMCEECDALWLEPECRAEPIYPQPPHLPCPACGASLLSEGARWATRNDLRQIGWAPYVLGEGSPLGRSHDVADDEPQDDATEDNRSPEAEDKDLPDPLS